MNLKRLICPNCACPILFTDIQIGEKIHCSVCHKSFRPIAKHHESHEHPDEKHSGNDSPAQVESKKRESPPQEASPPVHNEKHHGHVKKPEIVHPPIQSGTADKKKPEIETATGEGLALITSKWAKLRTLQDNGQVILLGFACLGTALFFANFPYVDNLVAPIALIGVFFGWQAFRDTTETANKRWSGALMGLGVVFASFVLVFPGVMRNLPDAVARPAIPEGYESTVAAGKPIDDLPWLDPKYPLMHHGVKLQVKECALKQYRPNNFTGFEKKSEVPLMLHLRISLTNETKEPVPFPGMDSKCIKVLDFKGDELPSWIPKTNPPDTSNPKAFLNPSETMEMLFFFNPRYLTQNQVKIQIPGILFGFPNPVRFEAKSVPKIKA